MENKKNITIKFSTFLLIMVLILSFAVIVVMGIYISKLSKNNLSINTGNINEFNSEKKDDSFSKDDINNLNITNDVSQNSLDDVEIKKTPISSYNSFINEYSKNLNNLNEDEMFKDTIEIRNVNYKNSDIFSITIDKHHIAKINFNDSSIIKKLYPNGYELKNVVNAFITPDGNGDYLDIIFIKDDGCVYCLNYNKLLNEQKIEINKNDKLKNIVTALRVGSSVVYVDINGSWLKN